MPRHNLTKLFAFFFALLTPIAGKTASTLDGQNLYDHYPWSLAYFYGKTVSDPLVRIFMGQIHHWPEHIQSVELAKTLDQDNFLRRFLSPVVGVVQLAGNVTYRVGSNQDNIAEFDPYLIFRWANMPWNRYLNTSLALAEGVSYASSIPSIEMRNNTNTKRLLNYLMFEATFAMPSHPELQLFARIHHRSGAYGLYRAGNTGSNDIGVGIKYLFA
ncbi:MAG: hypothetical protein ACD_46C00120G0007 [uncultured bacterium]|nr:MAG: hypothetical protein ACD_46C00120G0007 [uncultured bacterium]